MCVVVFDEPAVDAVMDQRDETRLVDDGHGTVVDDECRRGRVGDRAWINVRMVAR